MGKNRSKRGAQETKADGKFNVSAFILETAKKAEELKDKRSQIDSLSVEEYDVKENLLPYVEVLKEKLEQPDFFKLATEEERHQMVIASFVFNFIQEHEGGNFWRMDQAQQINAINSLDGLRKLDLFKLVESYKVSLLERNLIDEYSDGLRENIGATSRITQKSFARPPEAYFALDELFIRIGYPKEFKNKPSARLFDASKSIRDGEFELNAVVDFESIYIPADLKPVSDILRVVDSTIQGDYLGLNTHTEVEMVFLATISVSEDDFKNKLQRSNELPNIEESGGIFTQVRNGGLQIAQLNTLSQEINTRRVLSTWDVAQASLLGEILSNLFDDKNGSEMSSEEMKLFIPLAASIGRGLWEDMSLDEIYRELKVILSTEGHQLGPIEDVFSHDLEDANLSVALMLYIRAINGSEHLDTMHNIEPFVRSSYDVLKEEYDSGDQSRRNVVGDLAEGIMGGKFISIPKIPTTMYGNGKALSEGEITRQTRLGHLLVGVIFSRGYDLVKDYPFFKEDSDDILDLYAKTAISTSFGAYVQELFRFSDSSRDLEGLLESIKRGDNISDNLPTGGHKRNSFEQRTYLMNSIRKFLALRESGQSVRFPIEALPIDFRKIPLEELTKYMMELDAVEIREWRELSAKLDKRADAYVRANAEGVMANIHLDKIREAFYDEGGDVTTDRLVAQYLYNKLLNVIPKQYWIDPNIKQDYFMQLNEDRSLSRFFMLELSFNALTQHTMVLYPSDEQYKTIKDILLDPKFELPGSISLENIASRMGLDPENESVIEVYRHIIVITAHHLGRFNRWHAIDKKHEDILIRQKIKTVAFSIAEHYPRTTFIPLRQSIFDSFSEGRSVLLPFVLPEIEERLQSRLQHIQNQTESVYAIPTPIDAGLMDQFRFVRMMILSNEIVPQSDLHILPEQLIGRAASLFSIIFGDIGAEYIKPLAQEVMSTLVADEIEEVLKAEDVANDRGKGLNSQRDRLNEIWRKYSLQGGFKNSPRLEALEISEVDYVRDLPQSSQAMLSAKEELMQANKQIETPLALDEGGVYAKAIEDFGQEVEIDEEAIEIISALNSLESGDFRVRHAQGVKKEFSENDLVEWERLVRSLSEEELALIKSSKSPIELGFLIKEQRLARVNSINSQIEIRLKKHPLFMTIDEAKAAKMDSQFLGAIGALLAKGYKGQDKNNPNDVLNPTLPENQDKLLIELLLPGKTVNIEEIEADGLIPLMEELEQKLEYEFPAEEKQVQPLDENIDAVTPSADQDDIPRQIIDKSVVDVDKPVMPPSKLVAEAEELYADSDEDDERLMQEFTRRGQKKKKKRKSSKERRRNERDRLEGY